MSSRQLSATAEVVLTNSERLGTETDFEEVTPLRQISDCDLKLASKPNVPKFTKGDLQYANHKFSCGDYSEYSSMSCVEIFELFYTDEILQMISKETTNYALFKNSPDPQVTIQELRVFLGILILSGYNILPSKRNYWENSKDLKNVMVAEAMRRDRFMQICKFIHVANNNDIDKSDKMYKLRSLTDKIKERFIQHFVPEENLSYDESMIRYFGRHGCKQFIRGKPVRFGYKVWSLNTPSGYLINFEIYQGKNPRSNTEYEKSYGKAAAPLLQMIEEMGDKKNFRYNFFFDNLFTGANLLCTLKANGYGGTGTIRENRLPKNCPLLPTKQLEKQSRGDYSAILEKESGILYVRWLDNKVVTMASTSYGVAPVKAVQRFSRSEKKIVNVPRPDLTMQYNKNMGGTDQMDNNISWLVILLILFIPVILHIFFSYRIGVRSKKWYWPIFTYLIDAAIQNAWTLYRKSGRKISQLDFRRNIVQVKLPIFIKIIGLLKV